MDFDSAAFAGGSNTNLVIAKTGAEAAQVNQLRHNQNFLQLRNSSGVYVPQEYLGPIVDPQVNQKLLRVPGQFRTSGGPVSSRAGVVDATAPWNAFANASESTDVPWTRPLSGSGAGLRSIRMSGASGTNFWSNNANLRNACTFGSGAFVVQVWVKLDNIANTQRILEYEGGNNISYSSWLLWRNPARAGFTFESTLSNQRFDVSQNFGSVANNTWTLVTVSRDSVGNWNFFQDGLFQKTFFLSGTIPNNNLGLAIGHSYDGTKGSYGTAAASFLPMAGYLAGIEIYKGSAVTGPFTVPRFPYLA